MRRIVNKFHETSVRFNHRFAGGYAKHEIQKGLNYIDMVMSCAQRSFPEKLVYENPEVCSPETAFEVFNTIYKGDKKYIFDFARNDFYLARLNFNYDGVRFPIYLYMPFTDDSGVITIRDKPFYIKPVMADPLISVSAEGLFLPLNQTKMTTRARSHFLYKEGRLLQVKVHETTIHHTLREVQSKDNKEAKMRVTCNAHYLFCKFGYRETFLSFNAVVHAGYQDTINHQNYPKEDWVIYSSASKDTRDPQLTDDGERKENKVLLAVRRSDINTDVESVVGAFFYVLDFLPDIEEIEFIEDPAWWIIKMGKIIMGVDSDHRLLMRKMGEHYKTIDTYIDAMAVNLMADNDIYVNDIYEYLAWGISNYDSYRNRPEANQATMYDKYLTVNRYVFKPIREAIFLAIYELRQKKDDSKLTLREVQSKLRSRLRPDLITKINSNCPNVSAVISSTDSKLLKMALEIVPQDNMRTNKVKKTSKMLRTPKWQFDRSFIDVGGFSSMSKHEPIGKDSGNPCMNIGMDGKLLPQSIFEDLLQSVTDNTRSD